MGRIRSLKPEWLDDEALVEAGSDARALSVALILLADDWGNGRAGKLWLAARVFPGSPVERSEEAFAALCRIRYAGAYEVDGQRYFSIRNWDKHQRLDKRANRAVPEEPAGLHEPAGNITPGDIPDEPGITGESQSVPGLARIPLSSPASSPLFQLSSDQPDKSGSARVSGRAKSKPRTEAATLAPFLMHDAWEPDAEQVAALAIKYGATEDQVRAIVPEFRWFWKKNGKRVAQRAWSATFGNRVRDEAKWGTLYGPPTAPLPVGGPRGGDRASDGVTRQLGRAAAAREQERKVLPQ